MTKLVYPTNGIYKKCQSELKSCANNLSRAVSNCSLNIPSDFNYKNYLRNLDNTLSKYYNEIVSIDADLKKSDTNYENLESYLIDNIKGTTVVEIKERDRMII